MEHGSLIAVGVSILGNIIIGLITWGHRSELRSVRAEFRANMAEAELRIIKGINGTYTRTPLHVELKERVSRLENRLDLQ